MENNILTELVRRTGWEIKFRPYRMWHRVPYINNTALVFDETLQRGGYKLMHYFEFPESCNIKYITAAILQDAHSLGEIKYVKGKRVFIPFYKVEGKPAGFYTHTVGEGCSNL